MPYDPAKAPSTRPYSNSVPCEEPHRSAVPDAGTKYRHTSCAGGGSVRNPGSCKRASCARRQRPNGQNPRPDSPSRGGWQTAAGDRFGRRGNRHGGKGKKYCDCGGKKMLSHRLIGFIIFPLLSYVNNCLNYCSHIVPIAQIHLFRYISHKIESFWKRLGISRWKIERTIVFCTQRAEKYPFGLEITRKWVYNDK